MIRSLINPINIPTIIGKKEISVYEGEIVNTRKSMLAIKPIVYSIIIVPNDAIKGIQKDLLTNLPPTIIIIFHSLYSFLLNSSAPYME